MALKEALQTEDDETVVSPPETPAADAVTVVTVQPTTKNVRIKGTWTLYWGLSQWEFVDGQRYDIPADMFDYLRSRGNIYDTMV